MHDPKKLSDDKLISLLFSEGDALPRFVVDEVLHRGGLAERLGAIVGDPYNWNEPLPAWWAVTHAVFLLGAGGSQDAVLPLLRSVRYAEACENEWVSEALPSIFGSIGLPAVDGLMSLARDATNGWLVRAMALEGLAAVTIGHPERSEEVFRLIGTIFADDSNERELRRAAGHVLLDFLRAEWRDGLEAFGAEERQLPDRDRASSPAFLDSDVRDEFSWGKLTIDWYRQDWLAFYTPEALKDRMRRSDEEQQRRAEQPEHRSSHELCPVSADGKRKRCCLGKVGLA